MSNYFPQLSPMATVFSEKFEKVKQYLEKEYPGMKWNCSTGKKDLEGIISVLKARQYDQEGKEMIFEIDQCGNIRNAETSETLANIIEGSGDFPEVRKNVEAYLKKYLPEYTVVEIRRKSYHPLDSYLYMVSAKRSDGKYAVWTAWNESTQALNHGHYCLESEKVCEEIFEEYYFRR